MNRKLLVVAALVAAATLFGLGIYLYNQQKESETVASAPPPAAALVREHSPVFGNPDAKVTIVEFFDPACETCRAFHPIVKTLVTASFGRVRVVIRYAAFHRGSDEAVKILEAARLQGKFWPVLEATLEAQPVWASHQGPQPSLIWNAIRDTGIDVEKAKIDVKDPRIAKVLEQDTADVLALNVTKTPTFFVNGKPLVRFGEDELRQLVQSEMRRAYHQ